MLVRCLVTPQNCTPPPCIAQIPSIIKTPHNVKTPSTHLHPHPRYESWYLQVHLTTETYPRQLTGGCKVLDGDFTYSGSPSENLGYEPCYQEETGYVAGIISQHNRALFLSQHNQGAREGAAASLICINLV